MESLKTQMQLSDRDAAAIERRRRFEEERKKRIFDPKNRLIGVDAYALERQVADRRAQEEFERERDLQFALHSAMNAQQAARLEDMVHEAKRRANEDMDRFRMMNQKPEFCREFDIWDPQMISKQVPCRISDDDPRCGPSSAQKFNGEDLQMKERVKYQKMQQRSWLQQQMEEDHAARNAAQLRELALQGSMVTQDRQAAQLQEEHERTRRATKQAALNFNMQLAREQNIGRIMQQARDDEDKRMEIYNMVNGDFLTENSDTAISSFGPHRVVPDRWKGMSQAQINTIRQQQLLQKEQRMMDTMREEALKAAEENASAANAMRSIEAERHLSAKKQELDRSRAQFNVSLSAEQQAHKDYMERVVFANEATEKYFEKFNTTTR